MKSFLRKFNFRAFTSVHAEYLKRMHEISNSRIIVDTGRPCGNDFNCSKCPFYVENNIFDDECAQRNNAMGITFSDSRIEEMRSRVNIVWREYNEAIAFWKVDE